MQELPCMITFVPFRFRSQRVALDLSAIVRVFAATTSTCLGILITCLPASAQFKTELVNDEGATAPCMGIGPIGGPAAKKCTELFQQAGFLKSDELGTSGLTIGSSGPDDGVITHVDPGSPASQAGLAVGDRIISIDGKPVKPTPAMIAAELMFGKKGDDLHLKLRRQGSERDVSLTRGPEAAPQNTPKSPNFFVSVKPLIDWRGQFVPCMSIGPAGMAAIAYCDSHFKPFGYIKVGDRGSTGIELDQELAIVASVAPGSPAAKAAIKPGDEIVGVEGKLLVGGVGESATRRVFGQVGDQLHIRVQSSGVDKTVVIVLTGKPR